MLLGATTTHGSAGAFALAALGLAIALVAACSPDRCERGAAECAENTARTCQTVTDSELTSHTVWSEEACGGGTVCRVRRGPDGDIALCSRGDEPSAACAGVTPQTRCEGSKLVTCRLGVRVDERACAGACLAPTGCDEAFCADTADVEPACAARGGAAPATICVDDARIAWCRCGYRTTTHACANPGPRCVPIGPGLAGCR